MRKNNLKIFYIISSLVWMIIIFWESSIGDYPSTFISQDGHNDFLSSLVHILSYLMLCFLLTKSFIASEVKNNQSIIYGFILAVLYGATDEVHQYFVPGREMYFGDWLLDIAGSLIVFSFYKYRLRK